QVIILKARQLGISTLTAGYCLWKALFFEGATIYLLSKGQIEAGKLLDKCKILWEYLPDFMRLPYGKWQESAITFPSMHSSIDALPSTEDAGRMTGATIVVCDEWERHPYAETNYLAIRPTLGDAGQFIGLSTPDLLAGNTYFKMTYRKTMVGETDFYKVFLPWYLRPGRDEAWYTREKRNYVGIGFEGEYPSTEAEALTELKSARFFDPQVLDTLEMDCVPPKETRLDGIVRIYKPPIPGRKYCAALDPSDGQYDPGAGIVIDQTGEQVADLHGKLRTEELAVLWDGLVREYNNAFQAPEANANAGGAVIAKLKELETPNFYSFKKDKAGWWTSGSNRSTILLQLLEAITNGDLIIRNKEIIGEMRSFIVPEGKEPQASSGAHDDYIFACAIANQLRMNIPNIHRPKVTCVLRAGRTY
ncbi:MAG: hypothetical protein MUP81_00660, partial [Dehalococcoidia bacterium]|nr:hypothetical protein [Dehalococcoidia bacterium]